MNSTKKRKKSLKKKHGKGTSIFLKKKKKKEEKRSEPDIKIFLKKKKASVSLGSLNISEIII